jgi:hypothetical protein
MASLTLLIPASLICCAVITVAPIGVASVLGKRDAVTTTGGRDGSVALCANVDGE